MDCSLLGSSVYGILQARIWEWVAFLSPADLLDPGIKPRSSALQSDSLPTELRGKPFLPIPLAQESTQYFQPSGISPFFELMFTVSKVSVLQPRGRLLFIENVLL